MVKISDDMGINIVVHVNNRPFSFVFSFFATFIIMNEDYGLLFLEIIPFEIIQGIILFYLIINLTIVLGNVIKQR